MEKPLIRKRGAVRLGKSVLYCDQATWPFGKIELYEDRLFITAVIDKITLRYDQIKKVKTRTGKVLYIEHSADRLPFIMFAKRSRNEDIIKLLKQKKVKIEIV